MPINYKYCLWNNGEVKKVARFLFQKEMKIRENEVAYKSSFVGDVQETYSAFQRAAFLLICISEIFFTALSLFMAPSRIIKLIVKQVVPRRHVRVRLPLTDSAV